MDALGLKKTKRIDQGFTIINAIPQRLNWASIHMPTHLFVLSFVRRQGHLLWASSCPFCGKDKTKQWLDQKILFPFLFFFFFFADEIYQSINQSGYFYLLKCYVYVLPFVILIWVWRTGKTETHTLSLFFFLWGYVSVLVVRCNVYCVLYIILTR